MIEIISDQTIHGQFDSILNDFCSDNFKDPELTIELIKLFRDFAVKNKIVVSHNFANSNRAFHRFRFNIENIDFCIDFNTDRYSNLVDIFSRKSTDEEESSFRTSNIVEFQQALQQIEEEINGKE